jgi:hypothetical protein
VSTIAMDILSNEREISLSCSSFSDTFLFLLLKDIASWDGTQERTTFILGDLI